MVKNDQDFEHIARLLALDRLTYVCRKKERTIDDINVMHVWVSQISGNRKAVLSYRDLYDEYLFEVTYGPKMGLYYISSYVTLDKQSYPEDVVEEGVRFYDICGEAEKEENENDAYDRNPQRV